MFTKRLVPMEINVGNAVKFECEIEEAPDVSIGWFKDGHQVEEGDKYRIVSHVGTSCLEILCPIKEDCGEYTCKISNQHGSDECSASLTVTGKNIHFCGAAVGVAVGDHQRFLFPSGGIL